MTLYILVPVKPLAEAKSRLAAVLAQAERQTLAERLLRNVLQVVQAAQQQLGAVGVVISPDPAALALAAAHNLVALLEEAGGGWRDAGEEWRGAGDGGRDAGEEGRGAGEEGRGAGDSEAALNAALEQATAYAQAHGAAAVLILPADLPLLTLDDVTRLWRASRQLYSARALVVAPDSAEQGTNALLVRPPGALHYEFGPDSFSRHCRQAGALGMAWHVLRSPRLGLDVDLPEDLQQWLALERADTPMVLKETALYTDPSTVLADPAVTAFLQEPGLLMRLGTLGADGSPQVTPVWYMFQDGRFLVTTAADRVKARNMLTHPQVGFAIDSDQRPYRGITARGVAALLAEGEAARALTRLIAARYIPAARLEAMVDVLMEAPRVIFTIEVTRMTTMGL